MPNYAEILSKVDIRETGAVLLGDNFTVDGFWKRPYHVITHAHSDHLVGLNESVYYSKQIIATPATLEFIQVLGYLRDKNSRRLFQKKQYPLKYYEPLHVDGETLILLPSRHIIGSAQVLVETDSIRIGYTGDFRLGGETVVMDELDALIIESTYGDPNNQRPFKDRIEDILTSIVNEGLHRKGRVTIYGYHGKLQEAMKILRENGINAPFLMTDRIYKVTKLVEKYGWNIGNYYNLKSSEGKRILEEGNYILFKHMTRAKHRRDRNGYYVILSGWEFNEPARRIDENTWIVALSDHGDFRELIEYVELAKPKIVIVDASRNGSPFSLVRELRRRGWIATALPGPRVIELAMDSFIR